MGKMFDGKVAVVTGGGSGIGRASAMMFSKNGARVLVVDVAINEGEQTVDMIKRNGGKAIFKKADVSKCKEVEALIEETVKLYGRLDFAHNNAAIPDVLAQTADLNEEDWDRSVSVNLKGVWVCMKYEIPIMVKQGKGAIVNTTSGSAIKAVPGACVYNACKAGVLQLTRTAAVEYTRAGLRINAVAPGATNTSGLRKLMEKNPGLETGIEMTPIGRMAAPEEIAEAVIWLCSDAASFVTGCHLFADGGYTLM